jgi:hypothetical protein
VVWRDGVEFFEEESPWMGWLIFLGREIGRVVFFVFGCDGWLHW